MDKFDTADFHDLGTSDAIPNDFVVPYYLDEHKRRIAVARVEDRLYAFDDLCPCGPEPCPLSGGLLSCTVILCQCHGSRFDISSGAIVDGPAKAALRLYAVREIGGVVQLQLQGNSPSNRDSVSSASRV